MSVSLWAYVPEKCDGTFCVGDCEFCELANVTDEEEDDGR